MKRLVALAIWILVMGRAQAKEIDFSGEMRFRPEFRENADFNKNTSDTSSFVGSRIRLTAEGQAKEDVAVKVTIQDSRNWGEENSPAGLTDSGAQALDLHEGFVEFKRVAGKPVTIKAGRQELVYGDQRLVGSFGWSNQGRAFDAYKVIYANGVGSLDGWAAKRQENNGTATGAPDADRTFYGIYGTLKTVKNALIDVYLLVDREADTPAPAKTKQIITAGARVAGKSSSFDYSAELPLQWGDNGSVVAGSSENVKIQAFAFAAKAGFTLAGPWNVRLGTEVDYASGDDNLSDNKSKTFNNLYPTNHVYYGAMDYQGWRNMRAVNVNVSAKPTQKLSGTVSFWNFRLAEEKDGWYNAAGAAAGTLRAASAANIEKEVGNELDVMVRYAYDASVVFEGGVGHFFPGTFIKNRVVKESGSNWAYLMATVKF